MGCSNLFTDRLPSQQFQWWPPGWYAPLNQSLLSYHVKYHTETCTKKPHAFSRSLRYTVTAHTESDDKDTTCKRGRQGRTYIYIPSNLQCSIAWLWSSSSGVWICFGADPTVLSVVLTMVSSQTWGMLFLRRNWAGGSEGDGLRRLEAAPADFCAAPSPCTYNGQISCL